MVLDVLMESPELMILDLPGVLKSLLKLAPSILRRKAVNSLVPRGESLEPSHQLQHALRFAVAGQFVDEQANRIFRFGDFHRPEDRVVDDDHVLTYRFFVRGPLRRRYFA